MRRLIALAPLALLAACGNPDTPGGRAADARHESFEEMGAAMDAVGDGLKASPADLAAVRAGAAEINAMAPKVSSWFPAGSGPQDGMKTEALEAAWTRPEEFKQANAKFVEEAARFNALAQGGDVAAIGAGFKALGDSCDSCHKKFREE
jgi:cytochrome c556